MRAARPAAHRRVRHRPLRSSSSGAAPTCWWRTRGSTGSCCISVRASPTSNCPSPRPARAAPSVVRAGAAVALPGAGPPGRRRGMERALLGRRRSGLGRRRRAHERRRPRLGHGVVPRPLQLGRSVAARAAAPTTVSRLAYGYRSSSVSASQVVVAAELAVTPGSADAEQAAVTRHRAAGGATPAGRLQRRLGVHQPRGRLGRTAHRGGRIEGLPPGHGARVGEARQLHSGRQGRPGRRRARPHGARARRRGGAERGDLAGRGPPPRLRRRENGPVDGNGGGAGAGQGGAAQ